MIVLGKSGIETETMITTYGVNTAGKDYICSDIHGHFSLLEATLRGAQFDQERDRLFCLGDLIDRGDESAESLDWLSKPWFHAIQGNHERMLINTVESRSDALRSQWMMWGGSWAEEMTPTQLELFSQAFSALPLAIELMLPGDKSVGLVHAELPDTCDWIQVRHSLQNLHAAEIETTQLTSNMLWTKVQPYLPASEIPRIEPVNNIDHVFHGHTIVEHYRTITNRTFMDLGSYKTGRIGLVDPTQFV